MSLFNSLDPGRCGSDFKSVICKHMLQINSLWPSDAIWRQRSGSTLAQVMACCLTAPSHYLNQCWLIISEVQVTFILGQFHKRCLNHQSLKSVWKLHTKLSFKFPRGQWIKLMSTSCEIALRWMPQNTFDDKSTLVQVMTLCRRNIFKGKKSE